MCPVKVVKTALQKGGENGRTRVKRKFDSVSRSSASDENRSLTVAALKKKKFKKKTTHEARVASVRDR